MRRRAPLLAAVLACLVLAGAWYLVLWKPQTAALESAQDRLVDAESREITTRSRLNKLQATKKQEPALRSELAQLTAAVPAEPQLAELLRTVDNTARGAGVEYVSISQSEPGVPRGGASAALQLSIEFKGGYNQVLSFVDQLSGLPRILVVDSIDLSPENSESGAPILTGSMAARTFVAPAAPARRTSGSGGATTTTTAPAVPR